MIQTVPQINEIKYKCLVDIVGKSSLFIRENKTWILDFYPNIISVENKNSYTLPAGILIDTTTLENGVSLLIKVPHVQNLKPSQSIPVAYMHK